MSCFRPPSIAVAVTVVSSWFYQESEIILPLLSIEENEPIRDITTNGVTAYPMDTTLGYLLAEVDMVTTQLEFPILGVTNAIGNGLLFQQFFQWTQLMIGIDGELLEPGDIGADAGDVVRGIVHFV